MRQISDAGGIIPRDVRFCFDREMRRADYIKKVEEDSRGKILFLPRRTYENFLIDATSIADELNEEARSHGLKHVDALSVEQWISENAKKWCDKEYSDYSLDVWDWKLGVDAPGLLKAIFADLMNIEYRKTQHSTSLTRRLIERKTKEISALMDFVSSCVPT